MHVSVASRASPLARAQVQEILQEIQQHFPLLFSCHFEKTYGDIDQKTSLRTLNKTDFFTRELDQILLNHECRIAIHSAKDLPEPLPHGLKIIAITKGINSSDSLVLANGETLESLPLRALIATSSYRREEAVKALRADLECVDIRGAIEERLQSLQSGKVHGVVIAEAALIRLRLTSLNRMRLPGDPVPLQGKLAVVAREDDREMEQIFCHIDSRVGV